jgi:hypothetical protein
VGFYNNTQDKVVDRLNLTGNGLIPYKTTTVCYDLAVCGLSLQPSKTTTTSGNSTTVSSSGTGTYQYPYFPLSNSNVLGTDTTTSNSLGLIFSSKLGIGSGNGLLPGQGTYISVGLKPEEIDPVVKELTTETVHLTPEEKQAYQKYGDYFQAVATYTTAIGVSTNLIPIPQVQAYGKVISGVGALIYGSGGLLKLLALDPADSNFTNIQDPVFPSVSNLLLDSNSGLSQNTVDATNALINNLSQVVGVNNALLTALNRADGAAAANNVYWRTQQIQSAQTDSQLLSQLWASQPDLIQNYVNAIQSDPSLSSLTITKSQVDNFQLSLRANGFSAQQLQMFADLGIDSTSQQIILQQLVSLDPNSLTGSFSDLLSSLLLDPALNSSIIQAANAAAQGVLDPLATSVPEPSEIPGFIILICSIFYLKSKIKNN